MGIARVRSSIKKNRERGKEKNRARNRISKHLNIHRVDRRWRDWRERRNSQRDNTKTRIIPWHRKWEMRKLQTEETLPRRKTRAETSVELTRGLSKNSFHSTMKPKITRAQVEESVGEENGDSEYRQFYWGISLSHRLRINGIRAEKLPWEERRKV